MSKSQWWNCCTNEDEEGSPFNETIMVTYPSVNDDDDQENAASVAGSPHSNGIVARHSKVSFSCEVDAPMHRASSLNLARKPDALTKPRQFSQQPCDACLSFCQLLWNKWTNKPRPSERNSFRRNSRRATSLKFSCVHEDILPNTPGRCSRDLLKEATLQGRYAVAYSELKKLESEGGDPCEVLDVASVDRIRRIGQKFIEAIRMFDMKPSDCVIYEDIEHAKMSWGFQIVEGNLMQIAVTLESDCDLLRMFALDLNVDLETLTVTDEMIIKEVGDVHAHEATWHKLVTTKINTKGDDFIIVNCLDALDEPVGAVCIMEYSPEETDTTTPSGVAISPPLKGHLRCPYIFGAKRFVPLRAPDGKIRGVQRTHCAEIELPAIAASIVSLMPSFLVRRIARGHFEDIAKKLPEVVRSAKELDQRMDTQPRADFYEHLRRHLSDEA